LKRSGIRRRYLVGGSLGLVAVGVAALSTKGSIAQSVATTQTAGANSPLTQDARDNNGEIPARRVDPASPGYEGKEAGAWDELQPAERIARTEAEVAAILEEIDGMDTGKAQQQRRDDAMTILSAARSDYFGTDAGARRYLEFEQSIEGGR
jgi:hypothetical protein